jgi:hypothetical protein
LWACLAPTTKTGAPNQTRAVSSNAPTPPTFFLLPLFVLDFSLSLCFLPSCSCVFLSSSFFLQVFLQFTAVTLQVCTFLSFPPSVLPPISSSHFLTPPSPSLFPLLLFLSLRWEF